MTRIRVATALLLLIGIAFSVHAQTGPDPAMEQAKRSYRNRDFRSAVTELRAVLAGGDRADALYLLGYAHLMNREFAESVAAFSRCFAHEPRFDPLSIYRSAAE